MTTETIELWEVKTRTVNVPPKFAGERFYEEPDVWYDFGQSNLANVSSKVYHRHKLTRRHWKQDQVLTIWVCDDDLPDKLAGLVDSIVASRIEKELQEQRVIIRQYESLRRTWLYRLLSWLHLLP